MIVHPESAHVYEGIIEMAKSVETELKEEVDPDSEYPFEYYFNYKGIRFCQIEKERLAGYEDV